MYPNLISWNEVERGGHFAAFWGAGIVCERNALIQARDASPV